MGPRHPDTLTARANLAYLIGAAGEPAAARAQYTDLLPTIEEVLGPRHPDTLTARANLAYLIGAAGEPAAARAQYTDLPPPSRRSWDPGTPTPSPPGRISPPHRGGG